MLSATENGGTSDISNVAAHKREALLAQRSSLQHGNYLQAVEGLNLYRGLYSGRPNAMAEAFAVTPVWTSKTPMRARQHRLN